jgi:hypothetical protein
MSRSSVAFLFGFDHDQLSKTLAMQMVGRPEAIQKRLRALSPESAFEQQRKRIRPQECKTGVLAQLSLAPS